MLSRYQIGSICLFFVVLFFTASISHGFLGFFEGQYKPVKASKGEVLIALDKVSDGKAHYFSFKDQGQVVNFFVLQSPDGVVRAAFDACDVCFRAKKGYSQDGEFMICNNCGMRFHSSRINEVKGGCNPAPLDRTSRGDQLVIQVTDILSGTRFF
ncbi:MAG: DUF2318 domain-containing protein [Desulfotalea sp.]